MRRCISRLLVGWVLVCGGCLAEGAGAKPDRLAIVHYVPWQALNHSVAMSQRYYDMPLQAAGADRIESLRREIALMADAGIDAIATDIVPAKGDWVFLHNFGWMLEAAKGTSIGVFPCLNSVPDDPSTAEKLRLMVELWGKHPNWLHVDGRPVVSTFWGGKFEPEVYRKLERRLAEDDLSFFLLGDPDWVWNKPQTVESLRRYTGLFDAIYSFAEYGRGGHQTPLEGYGVLSSAAPEVARAKIWAAGIAPGYLGGWIPGRNDYYIPFRNLDQFVDCWEDAIRTEPDWVYLTTWNDRDETHIQPSLYQWETLTDISAYYIHRWKTGAPPDQAACFYVAYPREQLLGTVQRVELLSLAGRSSRAGVVATLELRGAGDTLLATMPARAMAGTGMSRVDWAVDTLPFAAEQVVYPVLRLKGEGTTSEYRLPAFVLRSGWIENQNIVKFPLARGGTDRASLRVEVEADGLVRASVDYDGQEPIKSAELFRNDMRVAHFDSASGGRPRVQLLLVSKGVGFSLNAEVKHGRILRALRNDLSTTDKIQWDDGSLWTQIDPHQTTAIELEMTDETTISFSRDKRAAVAVPLSRLLAVDGPISVEGVPLVVRLAKFDALADAAPAFLDESGGQKKITSVFNLGRPRDSDSYHVRLETVSGKVIETEWVHPGIAGVARRPISVIRSLVSMDAPKKADYISPPAVVPVSVERVMVSPAILQSELWDFNNGENPGRDSVGRNDLTLGRGAGYLGVDPQRVPRWLPDEGPDGSGCLFFDGVDDRAQLPVQQEPKGPFRIAFDLNPAGPPSGWQNILTGLGDSDHASTGIMIRRLEDGRLAVGRMALGLVKSPGPIPSGQWTHVEVQFTGNQTRLLIDGELVAASECSPDFKRFGNSRVYLGGPTSPLHGKIDNVLIEGFSVASP